MNWFFWRKPKVKPHPPTLEDLCKIAMDANVGEEVTIAELLRAHKTIVAVYHKYNHPNAEEL